MKIQLINLTIANLLLITTLAYSQKNMVFVNTGKYNLKHNTYEKLDTIINIPNFYIDKNEVTVRQFADFIEKTNYITTAEKQGFSIIEGGDKKEKVNWRHDEKGDLRPKEEYAIYPVIHVSWDDAVSFAKWKKKRLPREEEWEYAFREAINSKYKYSGSNNWKKVSWNSEDHKVISINPIKTKQPNKLEIYDMSGNVEELCFNPIDKLAKKRSLDVKVAKGGSYVDDVNYMKFISRVPAGYPNFRTGFRCVK